MGKYSSRKRYTVNISLPPEFLKVNHFIKCTIMDLNVRRIG